LISEAGAGDSPPKSGRTRKYDREEIVTKASEYVYEYGLPESQSKLIEKMCEILGDDAPADTLMKEVIGRFYKRMKAVDARR
jgi:hypothetical protein